VNGHSDHLNAAAKASAQRLGLDAIGLYQFHRPDPKVPYGESIGAIRDLLDEGVIELAGISNANVEQIDLANDVLGGRLVSVQNQFSPTFRSSRGELEHCAELGPCAPRTSNSRRTRSRSCPTPNDRIPLIKEQS
jgi:aryl-alcohol dehydrogenase-like predicted oxidoreductase